MLIKQKQQYSFYCLLSKNFNQYNALKYLKMLLITLLLILLLTNSNKYCFLISPYPLARIRVSMFSRLVEH